METWKKIDGYEHYMVSDLGKVRNRRKVLKGYIDDNYLHVDLSSSGRSRSHRVHRLVLAAFVGPCPEGMECRHLNGKSTDNRLGNLKWGTPAENREDQRRHGTGGEKYSDALILEALRYRHAGHGRRETAKHFGIPWMTLRDIERGKKRRAVLALVGKPPQVRTAQNASIPLPL